MEETGVEAKFDSLLAFRHMHGAAHGCSDFYFICLLRPLSAEIRMCTRELADCRWMPVRVPLPLSELCRGQRLSWYFILNI